MSFVKTPSINTAVRVATVIAAAVIGTLNMPMANASSGGGCETDNNNVIRACISASGNRLEPDLYILKDSIDGYTCAKVAIRVIDVTAGNKVIWSDAAVTNGCTVGVHGPWALDSANTGGGVVNGHEYQAYPAVANSAGTYFASAYSEPLTLSY